MLFILNPWGEHDDDIWRSVNSILVAIGRMVNDRLPAGVILSRPFDFWKLDSRHLVISMNSHAYNTRTRFGQGDNILCTVFSAFFVRQALTVDSIEDMAVLDERTVREFNDVGKIVKRVANTTLCQRRLTHRNLSLNANNIRRVGRLSENTVV